MPSFPPSTAPTPHVIQAILRPGGRGRRFKGKRGGGGGLLGTGSAWRHIISYAQSKARWQINENACHTFRIDPDFMSEAFLPNYTTFCNDSRKLSGYCVRSQRSWRFLSRCFLIDARRYAGRKHELVEGLCRSSCKHFCQTRLSKQH